MNLWLHPRRFLPDGAKIQRVQFWKEIHCDGPGCSLTLAAARLADESWTQLIGRHYCPDHTLNLLNRELPLRMLADCTDTFLAIIDANAS